MVRFENVSMAYGEHEVLRSLNLHIKEGQLAVLIGPSGCGKITTLQLINHLIRPTAGTVSVGGRDISTIDPVELRRGIGYVIQEIGLFPPYEGAPIVRNETLEKYPELYDVLNVLAGKIDDATIQNLNYMVDVEQKSVEEVAKDFLTQNGYI